MAIDTYSRCPGGSNKKVKFCGCKDIVHELDKVTKMMEGEQRGAALGELNRLLAKNPERACLLAMKSDVLMQLGEFEEAKAAVGTFVVKNPENPVALAQSALLEASEGHLGKAVIGLQRAIEVIDETMPMAVFEVIGAIGQALLMAGDILAARSHLLLQATLMPDDPRPMQQLMRLHGSPEIPLLLKQDMRFAECPAGVSWSGSFEEAMKLANRGAWLAGVERLEALSQQQNGQQAILRNIAILRSWLGENDKTIAAWRRYAKADGLALDDAVEAEALAQMLDPETSKETIDVLNITFPVTDSEKALEVLASDSRVTRLPVDPREMGDDDNPPPKGVYWLLDRPLPASGEDIQREDVPLVLAEMYLFGKQTDRDARLEFIVDKDDQFDAKKSKLIDLLGEWVADPESEEVNEQIGMITAALTWHWRFPDDTPPQHRRKLIEEQSRDVTLSRWPELPLSVLNGKKPCDVSSDEAFRVRLLAAILLLELGAQGQGKHAVDHNELRRKLDLPTNDDIETIDGWVNDIPLVRLSRVNPASLSDEHLASCYARAGRLGAMTAMQRLTREVIQRDSLDDKVDKVEAYEILSRLTAGFGEAIGYIAKARDLAVAGGRSPAQWLIAELSLRLERGIADECQGLVEQIQMRHMEEPGVSQALMQVLMRFGLITPDGQPASLPPEDESSLVGAGQEEVSGGGILLPGGSPDAGSSESKSKLILPD